MANDALAIYIFHTSLSSLELRPELNSLKIIKLSFSLVIFLVYIVKSVVRKMPGEHKCMQACHFYNQKFAVKMSLSLPIVSSIISEKWPIIAVMTGRAFVNY